MPNIMSKSLSPLFLALCCLFPGCGNSPLFNHSKQVLQNLPSIDKNLVFSQTGERFQLEWTEPIMVGKRGQFRLSFKDDLSMRGLRPFVSLWMPSMNHGSRPTEVAAIDSKNFLVSKVFFSMPGDWVVRIWLVEKDVVPDHTSDSNQMGVVSAIEMAMHL